MWRIEEHRTVDKELSSGRVPIEILKRYEKWKDIAMLSGPMGLRAIKGFRDEALSGDWKGAFSMVVKATGEYPLSQASRDLMDSWRYTESEMEERRFRSETAKCVFCGVLGRPKGADTHQCEKCGRWFCYHCGADTKLASVVSPITRCKEHPRSGDKRGLFSFFRG